ncbi:MAG: low temperature requirement protein A, partial [Pseudonocardiaceae bacterium]
MVVSSIRTTSGRHPPSFEVGFVHHQVADHCQHHGEEHHGHRLPGQRLHPRHDRGRQHRRRYRHRGEPQPLQARIEAGQSGAQLRKPPHRGFARPSWSHDSKFPHGAVLRLPGCGLLRGEPVRHHRCMATPRRARIEAVGERATVTPLELFFDLVFVFALTRVTDWMADEPTVTNVVRGILILTVMWWSWVTYAWLGNVVKADEGVIRVGMFVAMAVMFVGAITIP